MKIFRSVFVASVATLLLLYASVAYAHTVIATQDWDVDSDVQRCVQTEVRLYPTIATPTESGAIHGRVITRPGTEYNLGTCVSSSNVTEITLYHQWQWDRNTSGASWYNCLPEGNVQLYNWGTIDHTLATAVDYGTVCTEDNNNTIDNSSRVRVRTRTMIENNGYCCKTFTFTLGNLPWHGIVT